MIVIATQCFPPTLGGVETLMGGLADAVAASGRPVAVFADGAPEPSDAARGYPVRRFGGWKLIRRRLKARAVASAARSAELLICDSWKSLEHVSRDGFRAAVHCLAHGMEIPADADARKAGRIARAFAKADKVIANSAYTAELAQRFMRPGRAAVVATPPIAPQPEPTAEATAAMAARFAAAAPLVAFMGRLEPRKGMDKLIGAVADLKTRHPRLMLAAAGGGADRDRLMGLAEAKGVGDRVAFLGRVDEATKAALFARADLFAMPARRDGASVEGFGLVYLEAAWHGAPALAGREGGASDAVIDGETGLLCDGADQAAVTAALDALLSDDAQRARMGARAAEHARSQLWAARLGDFT